MITESGSRVHSSASQSQKAVSAYFSSKQILPWASLAPLSEPVYLLRWAGQSLISEPEDKALSPNLLISLSGTRGHLSLTSADQCWPVRLFKLDSRSSPERSNTIYVFYHSIHDIEHLHPKANKSQLLTWKVSSYCCLHLQVIICTLYCNVSSMY